MHASVVQVDACAYFDAPDAVDFGAGRACKFREHVDGLRTTGGDELPVTPTECEPEGLDSEFPGELKNSGAVSDTVSFDNDSYGARGRQLKKRGIAGRPSCPYRR